eukprot:jgi/Botrbrau1/1850/Bobra.146_1s0043.2
MSYVHVECNLFHHLKFERSRFTVLLVPGGRYSHCDISCQRSVLAYRLELIASSICGRATAGVFVSTVSEGMEARVVGKPPLPASPLHNLRPPPPPAAFIFSGQGLGNNAWMVFIVGATVLLFVACLVCSFKRVHRPRKLPVSQKAQAAHWDPNTVVVINPDVQIEMGTKLACGAGPCDHTSCGDVSDCAKDTSGFGIGTGIEGPTRVIAMLGRQSSLMSGNIPLQARVEVQRACPPPMFSVVIVGESQDANADSPLKE